MRGLGNVEKLKKYLVCLWVAAMIILVVIIGFRIVDADIILDQVRSTVLIQAKQSKGVTRKIFALERIQKL